MKSQITGILAIVCASATYGQTPATPAGTQTKITKAAGTTKDVKAKAASATFTLFPYAETIQGSPPENTLRHPGCSCGLDSNPRHNSVTFSPLTLTAKVGQPVTVRYDASMICRKQTIRDLNGTVHAPVDQVGNLKLGSAQWELGAVQDLPLEYGIITYPGYAQVGNGEIKLEVNVQCADKPGNSDCPASGYNTCQAFATIPIRVTN